MFCPKSLHWIDDLQLKHVKCANKIFFLQNFQGRDESIINNIRIQNEFVILKNVLVNVFMTLLLNFRSSSLMITCLIPKIVPSIGCLQVVRLDLNLLFDCSSLVVSISFLVSTHILFVIYSLFIRCTN